MAILIKNARVFAPKDLGVVDVLMANERILAVGKDLAPNLPDLQTVEAGGMIMTPGFFDQHIHVTGGGGEGGPATRTPELVLSELVACGTTDVVGVSGTDYTTRSIPNLLAKVRALQAEGVSAWMYTSNYRCPPTLLTDSIGNDLFFIPEVLGVKIALGDHRSSFPDVQTVLSMLADIRVGAMLAGKIGFLHIHNGNIPGAFAMYEEIVSRGFPVKHIRPTHCGRIRHVFVSAVDQEDAKRAIFTIKTIVEDPEIGAIYKGKVTRLMNFGAFVEIAPGKEGLVHISKLDTKRVERVEDVVAVGDAIVVKVTDIDQQGRINLSRRDAILALEAKRAAQEQQ